MYGIPSEHYYQRKPPYPTLTAHPMVYTQSRGTQTQHPQCTRSRVFQPLGETEQEGKGPLLAPLGKGKTQDRVSFFTSQSRER